MSVLVYAFQSDLEKIKELNFPVTTRVDMRVADHAKEVVVRWGKSIMPTDGAGEEREFLHVLNPSAAIRLNCRKPVALKKLSEVVKTPRMWTKRMPVRGLAVIRPFAHHAGSDFKVVKGPCKIPKGFYATEYFLTTYEVRVWVARTGPNKGEVIAARRVPMEKNIVSVHPCRSEWGYSWLDVVPTSLKETALKAATQIGLDLCAVDILRVKGEWIVLECNSCSSVDSNRLRQFWSEAIPKVAKAKYPRLSWAAPYGSIPPILGGSAAGYRSPSPIMKKATAAPRAPMRPGRVI